MIDDVTSTPGKLYRFFNDKSLTLIRVLVIFIMLQDEHLSQILSNVLQVKERGATTIVLSALEDISTVIDPKKIDFLIQLDANKSILAAL